MDDRNHRFSYAADVRRELDAIPIAREGMATDALRNICVRYMRLQLSFPWIASCEYTYSNANVKWQRTIPAGRLSGGLPCVSAGSGNLYRAMEFYDEETGVLDLTPFRSDPRYFGNTCSGAACAAWSRAISSVKSFGGTSSMTWYNGFIPVAPCHYDRSVQEFVKSKEKSSREQDFTPRNVCYLNGSNTMYEAYANTKPGDGLVSRGHVRMVSGPVKVIRDDQGRIVPGESYITFLDQVMTWKAKELPDGTPLMVQGSLDVIISFYTLFKDGYIPFTFAEFLGDSPVKPANVLCDISGDELSASELENALLQASYPISDIFLTVVDERGEPCYRDVIRNLTFSRTSMSLSAFDLEKLSSFAKSRTVVATLSCRLFNGEKITFFSGKLNL